MATINATKTGNWSDATVWPGGNFPTNADDVHANSYTITVDQSITVLSLRTTAGGGGVAGGGFTATDGRNITASLVAGSTVCVTATSVTLTITGSITGGSAANARGLYNIGGNVTVIGNVIGGTVAANANGILLATGGVVLAVTGNVTAPAAADGIILPNSVSQTVTITGNVTGGPSRWGMYGASGASGTITIGGRAVGGALAAFGGIGVAGANSLTILVDTACGGTVLGAVGISNLGTTPVYVKSLDWQTSEHTPTYGLIRFVPTALKNINVVTATGLASYLPEPLVCDFPAITDVRSGVVFGHATLTGTCAVPGAASVATGVPVDNTTGTSIISMADPAMVALLADVAIIKTNTEGISVDLSPVLADTADILEDTAAILADIYDLTHNEEGEVVPIVIPPPESGDTCTLYEFCVMPDSATVKTSITAVAKIIELPYNYAGRLHIGDEIAGTYSAETGLVSWQMARKATVRVSIPDVGFLGIVEIPDAESARVYTLWVTTP